MRSVRVVDGFLSAETASRLSSAFPSAVDGGMPGSWHKYDNPLEVKYALDRMEEMPDCFRDVFAKFQTQDHADHVASLMGISGLEPDPYLHGAGLHCMPPGGKLDMHLDYSIHPISGKERRVNLILFLNEVWKEEWGGELTFYAGDATGAQPSMVLDPPPLKVLPKHNRAVLFETDDTSWHGVPYISHSADFRKTLAIYYVSEPTGKQKCRPKATYARVPGQQDPYDRLREIRAHRRLTAEDCVELS